MGLTAWRVVGRRSVVLVGLGELMAVGWMIALKGGVMVGYDLVPDSDRYCAIGLVIRLRLRFHYDFSFLIFLHFLVV